MTDQLAIHSNWGHKKQELCQHSVSGSLHWHWCHYFCYQLMEEVAYNNYSYSLWWLYYKCKLLLVEQTLQPLFVKEPNSPSEVEINTTITLLWRIEYKGCSSGNPGGCLQLFLNTSNGHGLYDFRGGSERNHEIHNKNILFDAATTITPVGPNSTSSNAYANLRVIMFIDEFVRNNVPFLYCKVVVSLGGRTYRSSSMVNISVAALPIPLVLLLHCVYNIHFAR